MCARRRVPRALTCTAATLRTHLARPLQVLRQPADCYCVMLHADVASSWRLPADAGTAADATSGADAAAAGIAALGLSDPQMALPPAGLASRHCSSGSMGSAVRQPPQSALMFSGYVSHQQLAAALGSQLAGDPVSKVLRAAAAAAKAPQQRGGGQHAAPLATCRVSMRGPGGRGHADVAVSSFLPTADAGHLPTSTAAEPSAPGGGRPSLLGRAQQLARRRGGGGCAGGGAGCGRPSASRRRRHAAAAEVRPDEPAGAGGHVGRQHLACGGLRLTRSALCSAVLCLQ